MANFAVGGVIIPVTVIRTGDKNALRSLQLELSTINATVNNLNSSTKKAEAGVTGFLKSFNNLRWAMVNAAFVATFAVALAKPFTYAMEEAAKFELELKKIQAVTGQTVSQSMGNIFEARKGTPFSSTEVATAYLEFAKAGFSAQESTEALPAILTLAQASMIDLGDAGQYTAQILNQFGDEGLKASDVADILTKAANESAVGVDGLALAISYVGPIAAEMGMNLRDTAAAIEILTKRGLTNERAGTGLRQVLVELQDPSAKAQAGLQKLGVTVADSSGKIRPLADIIREFSAALSGLNAEQRNLIIGQIFDIRASTAVTNLIADYEETGVAIDNVSQGLIDAGYSSETAATMQEAAGNRWKDSINSVNADVIKLGLGFNKMALEALDALTPVVKYIEDNFAHSVATVFTSILSFTNPFLPVLNSMGVFDGVVTKIMQKGEKVKEVVKTIIPPVPDAIIKSYKDLEAEINNLGGTTAGFITNMQKIVDKYSDITKQTKISTEFTNYLDETNDKFVGMKKYIEDGISTLNKFGVASQTNIEGMVNEFTSLTSTIRASVDSIRASEEKIVELTIKKKDLEKQIDVLNDRLKEEKDNLKNLQDQYSEVIQKIEELSKARFVGETRTQGIIAKAQIWLKKEELAQLGVADAQQYITDALARTNDEYDTYFAQISKINSAMEGNKDAFSAWQETIKQAIRSEVQAGQELGRDVTSRVKVWQTALLGIQSAQTQASSSTGLDDFINKLQLANDVYYGGMHQKVGEFTQTQEDTATYTKFGNLTSSDQIIGLLQKEYAEKARLAPLIAAKEEEVAKTTAEIAAKQKELAKVVADIAIEEANIQTQLGNISKALTALTALETAFTNAAETIKNMVWNMNPGTVAPYLPGKEPTQPSKDPMKDVLSGIVPYVDFNNLGNVLKQNTNTTTTPARNYSLLSENPALNKPLDVNNPQSYVDAILAKQGKAAGSIKVNDALIRPGMPPVSFDQKDTIIATKGGMGGMGGNTSITVNMQSSGNPNYDAYQLARQIKLQMGV